MRRARAIPARALSVLRKARRSLARRQRALRRKLRFLRTRSPAGRVRILLGLGGVEDLTMTQRNELWPRPQRLGREHVRNCRVYEDRVGLLEMIPPGGVCAEMGCHKGNFSQHILEITTPRLLHLIDYEAEFTTAVRERYAKEVEAGSVRVHLGDTVATVDAMAPGSLDWAYIDGDHSYHGARRDLAAARRAVKPDGLIALNDYVFFNPEDFRKYGVVEAVNEFCNEHGWEMIGFGLSGKDNHDVLLRRRTD